VIRTNYDPEADILHVGFGRPDARSDMSEDVAPGVRVEFDADGNPIGIEITSIRRRGTVHEAPRAAALGS
jgi:uncharacterized protein YuzE